jgi:hypothetical protein
LFTAEGNGSRIDRGVAEELLDAEVEHHAVAAF